ncbi:MAG: rhomboid family intramembrane serine protease [Chloroflexi bacterium]|nr:rhomboid family intramembrane serine protease [Chloroflexota bacterium]
MSYSGKRSDNITPVLAIIILCFLVYIATEAARLLGHNLIPLLGLRPVSFLERPWTIVTNLFVHGGIWHLLANMLTLYFFGSFLIRLVSTRAFLIIYFLGGIFGNILFMLFSLPLGKAMYIVIGASGAVFALGGTLAVLTPRLRVYVFPIPVPMPLWVAVIGGFVIMSFVPGIAWEGHLGGLVCGLVAGLILRRRGHTSFY